MGRGTKDSDNFPPKISAVSKTRPVAKLSNCVRDEIVNRSL
jgi:hypothetical protein